MVFVLLCSTTYQRTRVHWKRKANYVCMLCVYVHAYTYAYALLCVCVNGQNELLILIYIETGDH